MKVNILINKLNKLKEKYGNLDVVTDWHDGDELWGEDLKAKHISIKRAVNYEDMEVGKIECNPEWHMDATKKAIEDYQKYRNIKVYKSHKVIFLTCS